MRIKQGQQYGDSDKKPEYPFGKPPGPRWICLGRKVMGEHMRTLSILLYTPRYLKTALWRLARMMPELPQLHLKQLAIRSANQYERSQIARQSQDVFDNAWYNLRRQQP